MDDERRSGRRWTRWLRWIATLVVVGAVGYFFATSLADNWEQVTAQHLSFDGGWVWATILFAGAVPVTGIVWARMLRVLDPAATVPAVESMAVQCLSWLLKYIPGQVGSVVNKVVWAGRRGISRTLVVITFVYENVFLQLASIVPAVSILLVALGPSLFGANATLLLLPLVVLVPIVLVLYAPFFRWLVNVPARRVLKQDLPALYFLSGPKSLRFFGEFLLPRILNGIGFVALAATVSPIGPALWLPFGAAYVLAGAIGILAVFVPSGLGVREAVIVLILGQYVTVPEAIVISLLARLLSTIGDALIAVIYLVLRRLIPKEHRP